MNGKRSSVIWLLAAALLAGLLLTSCGSAGKTAEPTAPAPSAAAESPALPTGADGETVSDLYRRAHEKFLPYYEKGHTEHDRAVAQAADGLKEEIALLRSEITELLQAGHERIAGYGYAGSAEEYRKEYVEPFETYYRDRMENLEKAADAYGAVSALMTYGGNSGGSASLEWQYVQLEIFYRELHELRDHLR